MAVSSVSSVSVSSTSILFYCIFNITLHLIESLFQSKIHSCSQVNFLFFFINYSFAALLNGEKHVDCTGHLRYNIFATIKHHNWHLTKCFVTKV